MRFTKQTNIALAVLAIIAALLALFVPWKCSAQAGEFNMTFQYSAGVDKAMKRLYGTDWINVFAKPKLREAYQNHKSEALESQKRALSRLFEEGLDPALLTNSESKTLWRIADSLEAREAEKKRLADSLAASGAVGELREDPATEGHDPMFGAVALLAANTAPPDNGTWQLREAVVREEPRAMHGYGQGWFEGPGWTAVGWVLKIAAVWAVGAVLHETYHALWEY